ncbi:GIY-YIG nuclease family protein [Streptomyces caatingaensis]|uniref:GIY-YIG nuclease family protein n=1 Tax=Streptomyces caatingaensis TaxID=1678637 RepID=UPI000AEA3983|nr:GIY-YIG nuclease family protein [Streptomyces caatingaensis]
MTSPESSPNNQRQSGEKVTAVLAWLLAVLIAVMEGGVFLPEVVKYGTGMFDTVSLVGSFAMMIVSWLTLLGSEQVNRHERDQARQIRRTGYAIQLLVVSAGTASCWHKSPWSGIVVGFMVVMSMVTWHGYMDSLALHPEDQKVLDDIIEQKRARERERLIEEQRQRRAAQLAEAAARYGYDLAEDQVRDESPPSIRWEIPARKHPSLVYFIRNGNRVKIGTTTDLRRRIRTLALRPEHVVLIERGGRELEREFHERFAKYRDGKTEWFRDVGALSEYIAERVEAIRQRQKPSEG